MTHTSYCVYRSDQTIQENLTDDWLMLEHFVFFYGGNILKLHQYNVISLTIVSSGVFPFGRISMSYKVGSKCIIIPTYQYTFENYMQEIVNIASASSFFLTPFA